MTEMLNQVQHDKIIVLCHSGLACPPMAGSGISVKKPRNNEQFSNVAHKPLPKNKMDDDY